MDLLDGVEKIVTIAATAVGAITGAIAWRNGRREKAAGVLSDRGAVAAAAHPTYPLNAAPVPAQLRVGTAAPAPSVGVPAGVRSAARMLRFTGVPIAVLVYWLVAITHPAGSAVAWIALVAAAWYLTDLGLAFGLVRGWSVVRGITWVVMVVSMPIYILLDIILVAVVLNSDSNNDYIAQNMLASLAFITLTVLVIVVLVGLAKPSDGHFEKARRS